jgi:CRP-like cAMP-binding protein
MQWLALLRNKIEGWTGPIAEPEWAEYSAAWEVRAYKAGAHITPVGVMENYFYFIVEGAQRAYFLHEGDEICVGFSYPYNFSGSYDSFIERVPAVYAIQAISDTQCLALHYDDLQRLYHRFSWVERYMRLFIEQMYLLKARHEIAVYSYTAEERVARLVKSAPQLIQMVPQKYLASYLGMKPETYSRIKAKLK